MISRIVRWCVIGCIAIGGLVWFLKNHFQDERANVAKELQGLCVAASKSGHESPAALAVNMLAFGNYFCDQVSLRVRRLPMHGDMSSEELVSNVTRARAMCDSLSFNVRKVEVTLEAEDQAVVDCIVGGIAVFHEESHSDEIRCNIYYRKVDGRWKVFAIDEEQE